MPTDKELMQQALDVMLAAIKAGDWKVDGACDPDIVLEVLRARLAQTNNFNPDWDAMAVMVEEQQRMAKRIEELESRLAQPEHVHANDTSEKRVHKTGGKEHEPVAWMTQGGDVSRSRKYFEEMGFTDLIPLYTAPPQREFIGLTDEEISAVILESEITLKNYCSEDKQTEYARAIEAKLREKNL